MTSSGATATDARLASTLAAVFKAYDVRGLVPDQIDDDLARRVGNAFVAVTGAESVVVGHDMRPSSPGLARAFAEGAAEAGADVVDDRARLHRPALLRLRTPGPARARCSPRATTPRSTTASSCAVPSPRPIGMETGLAEIRDRVAGRRDADRLDGPGSSPSRTCSATTPTYLLAPGARARAAPRGRRGRRQRDGRADRPGGAGPDRRRGRRAVLRARRHLPEPRGQPDRAGQPRGPPGAGARDRRRHRAGLRR